MRSSCKVIGSVDDLSDGDVGRLFYGARCRNKRLFEQAVLMTAFFEPSTRTRLSFEMAASRLAVKTLTYSVENSSIKKGETELLTITNLLALGPDILVIRSSSPWDTNQFNNFRSSLINAGDGVNEHPTQALTDCFTLLNHFSSDDLSHKKILIIGDLVHSRVARSNIKLMKRLGASLIMLAPTCYQMPKVSDDILVVDSFVKLHDPIDAVMCLRTQKERMNESSVMNDQEYHLHYGLTLDRFLSLGKNCVVMHPGPINSGVEIDPDVSNHPRSLILEQVKNGVEIRAALIAHCLY